jgi:hypothetical protein
MTAGHIPAVTQPTDEGGASAARRSTFIGSTASIKLPEMHGFTINLGKTKGG